MEQMEQDHAMLGKKVHRLQESLKSYKKVHTYLFYVHIQRYIKKEFTLCGLKSLILVLQQLVHICTCTYDFQTYNKLESCFAIKKLFVYTTL